MNFSRIRNEGWLYWLAFLIAFGFRFIQLGALPLTDSEARLALQSLHIAQGRETILGSQPLYILATSFVFLVTEASNFTARLLPALAGSLLVFAPQYFRDRLRPLPALILAFLISIDPGLVALSRQASGTILALTGLIFAWAMWRRERKTHAAIFIALALLSGPSFWSGILTLGLTLLFLRQSDRQSVKFDTNDLRNPLIAFIATILIGGTLFFTVPNGLSGLFNSLPVYLNGWVVPSVFTPATMLLTFLAYEIFGVFLAIFALIRGARLRSPRVGLLGVWLGVTLLLAVFYRQPGELIWAIVPLLILAAQELSRVLQIQEYELVEISVVAGAVMILLVYIWFNVAGIGLNPYEAISSTVVPAFGRMMELPIGPRYMILLGASAILVVCLTLVAFGWSPRTARLGITWSGSAFLLVYTLAVAWGASGLRTPNGVELWSADQPPVQANWLMSSVNEVSLFSRGHIESQPVQILNIDSPALEWALRAHEAETVTSLNPLVAPPVVVTPLMNDLGMASGYRGQDFTWRQPPQWDAIQGPDWVRWLVYRQLPRETETVILWARDDLFPDAVEIIQP